MFETFDSLPLESKPDLKKMQEQGYISKSEKLFLDFLEILLKIKITRQVKFNNCVIIDGVLDFDNVKIAIEFDGPTNHQNEYKQAKDLNRDRFLMEKGYSIYRCQFFEAVEYSQWHESIANQARLAVEPILNLIKLQKLKNSKKL